METSSVIPTMAFMGVRISWLILERKSLLAVLLASAFSSSACMMALRIRPRAVRRTMAITRIRITPITVTNAMGLA